MSIIKVETIPALTDSKTLELILGPITRIDWEPLGTIGFSGSTHDRLYVHLRSGDRRSVVVKRVDLGRSWTAYRTGDTLGREASLLDAQPLRGIWEIFSCPYLAYAVRDGEVGLLMDDLSDGLLPDVDAPLSRAEEDELLSALATMHARYWDTDALDLPWLTSPAQLFAVLGPKAAEEEASRGIPHPLFAMVAQGWRMALAAMPRSIAELFSRPPAALARECADLPKTIIHGDAKVANFALLGDGGVAAFDWAWIGAGPCTLDLGWYLAVNARRLAGPREEVIERYRALLETGLRATLSDDLWERLMWAGIRCAALTLLWAKALALDTGSPDAIGEWDWWMDQLRSGIASGGR